MKTETKTADFDLKVLWIVAIKRWVILLLALVIGLSAAFCYSKFIAVPSYSSRSQFIVRNTAPAGISSSYLQGTQLFSANYVVEIRGNLYLEQAAKACNERYETNTYTANYLRAHISTSVVEETSVFVVRVTHTDPQEAYRIIRVVEDTLPEYLTESWVSDGGENHIRVSLIDVAELDKTPDSPNLKLNLVLGGGVCLLGAYLICLLLAVLDNTVYGEEDIKQNFEQPMIGTIPEWQTAENARHKKGSRRALIREISGTRDYNGQLLTEKTPFSITESFKTLRTNLIYTTAAGEEAPVLGITSALSGAGKSLIISNVAISFAQLGKKVLLIDGDMRCPAQYQIFGIKKGVHGLSEALAGICQDPLSDSVHQTQYENLSVMPCGHRPPNPSELLASERMKQLLAAAKTQYDFIFIDLPPICETTDAGVVSALVTGYILVARAGYSNTKVVRNAATLLESLDASILGFVLNGVSARNGAYHTYGSKYLRYGKYSRYGYGRSGRYERAAREVSEHGDKPSAPQDKSN